MSVPLASDSFQSNMGIVEFVYMSDKDKEAAIAGALGTAAGAAGSVGTVAAAGTVTGLGATGITSGLAAVGGVVGGGMATGLALTVGAPVLIGTASYGLYKWFKN